MEIYTMNQEIINYLSEKVIADLRIGKHLSPIIYQWCNRYSVIGYFRARIDLTDLNMILTLFDSEEKELRYFAISLSKNIVEQETIRKKLFEIWQDAVSNYSLRREVMWRILDIQKLPKDTHKDIYNFVLLNWDNWAKDTLKFYGDENSVLDAIINRSKDSSYIEDKHWIYICLATLSTKKERAKQFVSKYLDSKVTINSMVARDMIKKL